ncbi:universal stress protein [Embleya sp. NBC_00896]|uniref:universal stress protein n=1 Tax=Embleya sp. NBC_00896 TaxID=2975961 RepID=UPI002F91742D
MAAPEVPCGSFPPSEALLETAKRADLLVVGGRGHGGFTGMLLGSVSLALAGRATCPVLVARTPGHPDRRPRACRRRGTRRLEVRLL